MRASMTIVVNTSQKAARPDGRRRRVFTDTLGQATVVFRQARLGLDVAEKREKTLHDEGQKDTHA